MSNYRLKGFDELLAEELRDPEFAKAYLADAFNDSKSEFLIALRKYVQANGGMALLAKNSGIRREVLYRMLSEDGNPRFDTFQTLIESLGYTLELKPQPKIKPKTTRQREMVA